MRHILFATCAAATALSFAGVATAADILSQDNQKYELTIISGAEEIKVTIPPKSDLRSVCAKSCEVRMPDGQSQKAGPNDILFIVDGKIILYES